MYFVLFFFVCVDSCIVCDKQLIKPQLLSTHLPWDNWKSNPVIYSQLFKYTKQHTSGFTENKWATHLLRQALAISGFRRKHTCYHTFFVGYYFPIRSFRLVPMFSGNTPNIAKRYITTGLFGLGGGGIFELPVYFSGHIIDSL